MEEQFDSGRVASQYLTCTSKEYTIVGCRNYRSGPGQSGTVIDAFVCGAGHGDRSIPVNGRVEGGRAKAFIWWTKTKHYKSMARLSGMAS